MSLNDSEVLVDNSDVHWCTVVDFNDFRDSNEKVLSKAIPLMKEYLLVHHVDSKRLIHWTSKANAESILKNGFSPSRAECDFGAGVYAFIPGTRDSKYVFVNSATYSPDNLPANRVALIFTTNDWYQCILPEDSNAAFRYCFVKNLNSIKEVHIATEDELEIKISTLSLLRRMGFEFKTVIDVSYDFTGGDIDLPIWVNEFQKYAFSKYM